MHLILMMVIITLILGLGNVKMRRAESTRYLKNIMISKQTSTGGSRLLQGRRRYPIVPNLPLFRPYLPEQGT